MYVNDGIVAVEGENKGQEVSIAVQKDLRDAGFITNVEKSNWLPRRHATWLGFDINLESAQLVVPKSKIETCTRKNSAGHKPEILDSQVCSQNNRQYNFNVISLRFHCKIHDPGTLCFIEYQTFLVS